MRSPKATQIVKEARKWISSHQKADSSYAQITPLFNLKKHWLSRTIELKFQVILPRTENPLIPTGNLFPHNLQLNRTPLNSNQIRQKGVENKSQNRMETHQEQSKHRQQTWNRHRHQLQRSPKEGKQDDRRWKEEKGTWDWKRKKGFDPKAKECPSRDRNP